MKLSELNINSKTYKKNYKVNWLKAEEGFTKAKNITMS